MCVCKTKTADAVLMQANELLRVIKSATGGCWQMQEAPSWRLLLWDRHPSWWVPCFVILRLL
jgi:hypothetical protein